MRFVRSRKIAQQRAIEDEPSLAPLPQPAQLNPAALDAPMQVTALARDRRPPLRRKLHRREYSTGELA